VSEIELTPEQEAASESGGARARRAPWSQPATPSLDSWLRIHRDGTVTVYTGKVEVGQNIRTSLTQAVAEELRVPVEAVRLVMGDTDLTPFDMGTFGSMTTPLMASHLRKAAATAREILIARAARRWKVDPSTLDAVDGRLVDPASGRSIDFGKLTAGRKLGGIVRDDAATTPASRWKVAGTSVPKVDGAAVVTGRHRYTPDIKLPGMLYGKVLRPPAFGAELVSVDTEAAEKMTGVKVVREDSFVGVAAPDRFTAMRAIAAMQAEWRAPRQLPSGQLFEHLKTHPVEPEGYHRFIPTRFQRGDLAEGFAAAQQVLERSYTVAYIAHAPLETRAALARWENGELTVWTGTQRPFGVRGELAAALGIPEERVRVLVPDTGSGYGGKHTGEVAIESARLSRGAGKPVSLTWTREEEFTWAYFRNAGVIDIKSGVRSDGTIIAWEFHNYNSGPEAMYTPYAVPNQYIQFHFADSPLRQGSYRALAATANVFARETHMDEIARAMGMDPLSFRLKNLQSPRLRAVFEAAADRFGWGKAKPPEGHGFGIAGGFEKDSYVAICAEVAVDMRSRRVRIVRVVEAFDCGAVVNPDGLRNQIEGSIVQAIGGALFERIEFDEGKILNPRFSQYRVPRFSDLPAIETILIDRKDVPSAGAGETPIVGLAPAVGNAIFDATGIRLRSMPLAPNGLPS